MAATGHTKEPNLFKIFQQIFPNALEQPPEQTSIYLFL